jgi:hypothetical protein
MLIKVKNSLDTLAQSTYLSQPTAVGAGTFPVSNINGGAASWAIQLGKTGEEKSEVLLLSASTPSGTALVTTGTARYDHPTDTPVYFTKYDQIVFKVSTTGTAGAATAISGGTVTITPDGTATVFDHTTGASTYAYKSAFYSSVLAVSSSDSDWQTPSGFTFYSKAKIRQRIRSKLFDSSYIPLDSDIDDWINEWLETMTNAAINVNKDYSLGTVDVTFSGTAQLGTITATDYKDVRRVWMTTDGVSWHNASKKDIINIEPNAQYSDSMPKYFFQGDNIIGRVPNDTSATARLVYYKTSPVLANETDELPVVMRAYTKSFIDYGESQARKRDGKIPEAQTLEQSAKNDRSTGLAAFVKHITPRAFTGVTFVEEVEPTSGEDGMYY